MFKILSSLLICFSLAACSGGNNDKASKQDQKKEIMTEKKSLVFFGNSLTAGYGLEDPSDAFPALVQHKIDSLNLDYKVVNAGLSGETTSGGNSRIEWLLKQKIDVFVLELGANDGLRGIPVTETKKNLQSILDKVKAKYPDAQILLLGMQIPPNMGAKYAGEFKAIYQDLASENKVSLVPFLLEGVAGNPKLNLKDGIHPTAEGYKIVVENVWEELKGML